MHVLPFIRDQRVSNKTHKNSQKLAKTHNKRNHKRNIIWFNHPFSKNASTKISKYFLNLLDKHFPQNHRLHKIFNRNSVKVSYSCTKNMKTIINNHNKNIIGKKPSINTSTCNCRNKEACPLNGQCQIGEVVYESTQITKTKSILELRRNLSKDAYTATIYLSEMSFVKTTQNFLRNSGKSR